MAGRVTGTFAHAIHAADGPQGAVGTFEVNFSGTLYEGINYVRGPGSTQKLSTPPPMAKHGMIFEGVLVGSYVRVVRESSGLYDGLYVPCAYEGRRCVQRVADSTPLRPARPRTPPEQGELSSDVKGAWDRYFAEKTSRRTTSCARPGPRPTTARPRRRRRRAPNGASKGSQDLSKTRRGINLPRIAGR